MDSGIADCSRLSITHFYDEFSAKHLRDYVYGNARVAAATAKVCSAIESSTRTILDIGCGIGISSSEYARQCPSVRVRGVDISPRNIAIANKLFANCRCTFDVCDVTAATDVEEHDVIALLDVYEHIPRDDWRIFNVALSNWLSSDGTLVMTSPTPLHQAWLGENNPAGLQIVDETVEFEDVVALAMQMDATIVDYQWVSIWHTNDYFHVVMTRNPKYRPLEKPEPISPRFIEKVFRRLCRLLSTEENPIESRRVRVKEKFGIEL